MIISVVEILLFAYFTGAVLYIFIKVLAARLVRTEKLPETTSYAKVALLVPAYKEDAIISSVAQKLVALDYPKEFFEVIVIADSLQANTLESLSDMGVRALPVRFEKSTKMKSLNFAFNALEESYDLVIISDADNIPEKTYLRKVNNAWNRGHKYIQTQRVAKNLDTPFAILDGISEGINNTIFRKGAQALGLSSAVIGSGMVFPFKEIKKIFSEISAVGGFDKILQLRLVEHGDKIYYLEDALIFDEKISTSHQFSNQRRRWLSSQFRTLGTFMKPGMKQLFKGNWSYFDLAILSNLVLPRVLLLGFLGAATVLFSLLSLGFTTWLSPIFWWILFAVFVIALFLAIPRVFFRKEMLIALKGLPSAFFRMVLIVFKLKGADQQFIHTAHSKVEVENNLYNT